MTTAVTDRDVEEPEEKGTISFSVRLTKRERDLLRDAAKKRARSLTSLLKNAALDKAVHILNTSAPSRVDFRGTAEEVARQLFAPRSVQKPGEEIGDPAVPCALYESVEAVIVAQDHNGVAVSPWCPPSEFLGQLRDAVRYGGTEFLDLLVQASDAITTRNEGNMPDPIDPRKI